MKTLTSILALLALPATAVAERYDDVIHAELRPGWRLPNGDHMAALHLSLAPGWKTYWRSPGDAGIPPMFDWRGGQVSGVEVEWPAPHVFYQSGMRSVGYEGTVVLPLRVSLKHGKARDSRLRGVIDIGICKDVCLPHRIRVEAVLPASGGAPDPQIIAALADVPFSADEAGVRSVSCNVSLGEDGISLRTEIGMKPTGGRPETVIELPDPNLWVSDPESRWSGGRLVSESRVMHANGQTFALNRSDVRITVLTNSVAVDIDGCAP
ncbi:protein-disulfide reductase DsbD domain-containing protein [Pacificoceanicola onchidii]|uniref:protein-disulfide reductase DsbD domain-containing protein n=1 Tax=Pacificoceanicola onchidii TaxID=2562685 RepID=UPI0010A43EB1|nr:protein-disulfide reductase DsbD domain-containing protein [Pacificoceanicola onchidii]